MSKNMSLFVTLLCIGMFFPGCGCSERKAVAFELTKDNPETLIGTNSSGYSISGFKLGITHDEAWQILEKNNSLIGVKDQYNPSRVYVYTKNQDGSKGKSVLYLIWEPETAKMKSITVFQDYRSYLSRNFCRLLSFEAVDNNSEFKGRFVGYANRSKITLDVPSTDLKHTTYFYDEIGLEITHKHSLDGDEVVFAIFQAKP
jgi:hypothetical protein